MEETLINGKPLSFYLRHPSALKLVDRHDLTRLAELYPFSAHLHLLITVKDHLDHNATNRDLLERAALYISDRRKLGEWMNKLQSLSQDDGSHYGKEHLDALYQSLETLQPKDELISNEADDADLDTLSGVDYHEPVRSKEADTSEDERELWVEKVPIPEQSLFDQEIKVTITTTNEDQYSPGTVIEADRDLDLVGEQTAENNETNIPPDAPIQLLKIEDVDTGKPLPPEDKTLQHFENEEDEEPGVVKDEDHYYDEEEQHLEDIETDQPEQFDESPMVDEGVQPPLDDKEDEQNMLDEAKEELFDLDLVGVDKQEVAGDQRDLGISIAEELLTEITDQDPTSGLTLQETEIDDNNEPFDSPFLRWLHRLEDSGATGYEDFEAKRRSLKLASDPVVPHEKEAKEVRSKPEKKKKKKKKKKKSWKMESLVPDETLVSEALADLLASQGHIERAREMYEKLRLTIPEKSVFFAHKIKALEQKK